MAERSLPPAGRNGPSGSRSMTLRELLDRLLRHRLLIGGVAAGVVALVAAWTLLQTPRYESTAVLRIVESRSGLDALDDLTSMPGLELGSFGEDDLETEVGVLRSWRIASAVVDSLGLAVRLTEPASRRTELLEVTAAGDENVEAVLELSARPGGGWSVEVRESEVPVQVAEAIAAGEPLNVGGHLLRLRPVPDPPETVTLEIVPFYRAVDDLREELDVRRQEGGSRLVEVAWESPDRRLAAAVVNSVVGEYVEYRRRTESGEARRTTAELRRQVDAYASRLAEAEDRLRDYQVANRLVAPEEQAVQQVKRIAELTLRADGLQVERNALGELMELLERRAAGEAGPSSYRQLATYPSLISSAAIEDMLSTLLELENTRSELLARRTEENVDVQRVTDRIRALEGQLHRVGASYLENVDQQLASTARSVATLEGELERLPDQEMQYARLLRDREILNESYLFLEQQLKQAEVQDAIRDDEVRVVDAGVVPHPDDPSSPDPVVNLFLAVVLGLAAGVAVALTRDLWDDRVHSPGDARLAAPGLPIVGLVPPVGRVRRPTRNGDGSGTKVLARSGRKAGALVVDDDPWTPAAEAYRSLALSLSVSDDAPGRVLLVTSARPGDGKSTVAANLAAAFAQQGLRTLLVDADLRRGRLAEILGCEGSPGLVDLLRDDALALADGVRSVDLSLDGHGLDLLPSGGPLDRPTDLAGSTRLDRVLADAGREYARVVVDSPPVEQSADATALASRVDAALVVARQGTTDRGALERTVEQLERTARRVRGLVLNDASGAPGYTSAD